jgi:hypothetical protein
MKSKEFPEQVLLQPLMGRLVTIKFDGHEFTTRLISAEPQKLTSLINAPAKRKSAEGKSYTPKCLRLTCEAGALVVVCEDYKLVAITNGVAFMFDDYVLEVRCAD